jgi:hypothetical protein
MTIITAACAVGVLLLVFALPVTGALAQDAATAAAPVTPEIRPTEEPSPPRETPSATPAADSMRECISSDNDFKASGRAGVFVVALKNACEKRFRCNVNAYVVTAFGPSTGKAVLTLAPKSHGAAAHQSYTMKIKENGGSANVAYRCKVI